MKLFLVSALLLVFGCQTSKPAPKSIEQVNLGDQLKPTIESKAPTDCTIEVTGVSNAMEVQGLMLPSEPIVCGVLTCPKTYPQYVGQRAGGCLPFEMFRDRSE